MLPPQARAFRTVEWSSSCSKNEHNTYLSPCLQKIESWRSLMLSTQTNFSEHAKTSPNYYRKKESVTLKTFLTHTIPISAISITKQKKYTLFLLISPLVSNLVKKKKKVKYISLSTTTTNTNNNGINYINTIQHSAPLQTNWTLITANPIGYTNIVQPTRYTDIVRPTASYFYGKKNNFVTEEIFLRCQKSSTCVCPCNFWHVKRSVCGESIRHVGVLH